MAFSTSYGVVRRTLMCPVCGREMPLPPMQPAITDATVSITCPFDGTVTTTQVYLQSAATGAEIDATSDVSAAGANIKVKTVAFTTTANTNAVTTGWAFPAKAILITAWTDVTTADTGKTISVGDFASNSNEYLTGLSIGTTGIKLSSLVSGAVTLGSALIETVTNSGSATHSSRKIASVGGLTVGYKTSAAATTAGNIYLLYVEVA